MTLEQVFVLVTIAIPLILAVRDRIRLEVAALIIAVVLGLAQYAGLGVLGPAGTPSDAVKAIAGLGEPAVLTLFSLFIITAGLEQSGLTQWAAERMLGFGGNSVRRQIALCATTSALLSTVMNNLAAGALVLPCALEIARRAGIKPSKLLIPVAYGSLLGGSATYFATANILVSDLLTVAHPP